MIKLKKLISLMLPFLLICVTWISTAGMLSVSAASTAYINGTNVNIRADASVGSNKLGQVSNAYVTVNGSKQGSDGYTWYNITYNGITGYIQGNPEWFVLIEDKPDPSFEEQLKNFPESYREGLRAVHAIYPNWNFYADNISLSLDEAVELELTRKQVQGTDPISWLSMGEGAYDWNTGKWIASNGGWYTASREVIKYYMDPRNFLNVNEIYMFMQQSYDPSKQTEEGLAKIIKGTFLEKGYSDPKDTAYGGSYVKVIMAAAQKSGVSPYVLASTIIMEQGNDGKSSLISGTYSGFEGYYNFFNVGASGSDNAAVIRNGLTYAKNKGWNTRSAAIIGGAEFCGNNYIDDGQDTYFYMNYNIKDPANIWHQYAQAVHNALSSGKMIAKNYSDFRDAELDFKIPVYKSMPSEVSALPDKTPNRNNYYFDLLTVSGLTPSFERFRYEYDLKVSGNTTVNFKVPSGASYAGPSSFAVSPGNTRITLPVKSQSGYINNYYIDVNSSVSCTITIGNGSDSGGSTEVKKGDTNNDGSVNGRDLANVQMHILKVKVLTGDALKWADTNGDGSVNGRDLANIQMHILGVKALF